MNRPFFGVGLVASLTDLEADEALPRKLIAPKNHSLTGTIFIVIISALLFIAIIAIFEVFRAAINDWYIADYLTRTQVSEKEKLETQLAEEVRFNTTMAFAILAVIAAMIGIPLLMMIWQRHYSNKNGTGR